MKYSLYTIFTYYAKQSLFYEEYLKLCAPCVNQVHYLHHYTNGLSPDWLNPQRALEKEGI